jgi:hypothetical protein
MDEHEPGAKDVVVPYDKRIANKADKNGQEEYKGTF